MNKRDLVERVPAEHELTGRFARELADGIFDMITSTTQKGEEVSLFGFGTFKVSERAARKGRNPRTGETVKVAASKTVKFKPATSLKASLNKRRRASKGKHAAQRQQPEPAPIVLTRGYALEPARAPPSLRSRHGS